MYLVPCGAFHHCVVFPGLDPPQKFSSSQNSPGMVLPSDLRPFNQRVQLVVVQFIKVSGLLNELLAIDGSEVFERNPRHFCQELHESGFVLSG